MSEYFFGGARLAVLGGIGAVLFLSGGQGLPGESRSTVNAVAQCTQDKSEAYTIIPVRRPSELSPPRGNPQGPRTMPHVAVSDSAGVPRVHIPNELLEIRRQIGSAVTEILGDEFTGEPTEDIFREELIRIAAAPTQDQQSSHQPPSQVGPPSASSAPFPSFPNPPTTWGFGQPHHPLGPQSLPQQMAHLGVAAPQDVKPPQHFSGNPSQHFNRIQPPNPFYPAGENFQGSGHWANPNHSGNQPQPHPHPRVSEVRKLRDFARRMDDMANDLEENSFFELADQMREQAQRCRVLAREKSVEASSKDVE